MKLLLSLIVFCVAGAPIVASAQSLADIAKREETRRKTLKQAGKVYTNDSLRADITASPAPATPPETPPDATPAPPSTRVPEVNLPAGKVETAPVEKDQKWWKERITAARAALDRSQIFAEALQSRINALSTDIVNRDDPAQRSQLELERQRALGELERVKKEIADHAKAIAEIEEEARKAGVPPGWLR
jgi:hypothetical protein